MDQGPRGRLTRWLLKLRIIGYFIAVPALAIAWYFSRSSRLAILAAAAVLPAVLNITAKWRNDPFWTLATDLGSAAFIWWLYGPVETVSLLLLTIVVLSSITLSRRRSLIMVAATVTLTWIMAGVGAISSDLSLPHFYGSSDGKTLPVLLLVYASVLMLGIARVIERGARELTTSEQQLRLAFDRAATGMMTFEPDGTITQVNRALCEQVGYTQEALLSMTWRDLTRPEDQAATEQRLLAARNGGPHHWKAEVRVVRADRSEFWAGVVVTMLHDEAGVPLSYFAQVSDISEQKAAQEALVSSERRYRGLFEGIPVALYRTSREGKIIDANPALVDLLGFPDRESMLAMDVHDAYSETNRREEFTERLEATGRLLGVEEQLLTHDGNPIWVRDSSRVVHDENGEVAYYEGALVDTTSRHAAENALRESEARLRAIFDHAPIGVVAVEMDHTIVAANAEFARMTGRSVDELRGSDVTPLTHPDDRNLDKDMLERLVAGEISSYRFTKRYVHTDGHTIWVELAVTLVRDEHGDPELLIGLTRDISDQREVESDRDRLIRILEATSDLVVILDFEGRVDYANAAARDWIGFDPDATLSTLDIFTLVDGSSGPGVTDIFEELRASNVWRGDLTLKGPSGDLVPGSAVVVAHRDGSGRITHFSATFRDLVERVETQRRLEHLIKSKDEFVASVSHELRTPLTAVVGLAQELRGSWNSFSTKEISEFIGLVADQATEVANLVEDLLVAARADIGKVTVRPTAVDMRDEIEGVMAALGPSAMSRVSTDILPIEVWADPTRLRQIIRNLLTNAIRYGGRDVQLATSTLNGTVELRISDDGPGISPGLEERIFEPYARAHEPGSQPHSVGLGLTVSRHLARLMGGDLRYERAARSTFVLTLPSANAVASSSGVA